MARLVTLLQLRTRAKQRADMENSSFISDSEWNGLISDSATELYDILVTAYEDYYKSTFSITTTANTSSYALPATFYKLLGVDQISGSNRSTLKPYNFLERNAYTRYSTGGDSLELFYIPACPVLTLDADTFDGINGWDEYIVIDAAIKAKDKEESDSSRLERAKAAILKRIEESAPNRDAGWGDRVSDVYRANPYDVGFFTSATRYRALGGNLELVISASALGQP